MSSVDILLTHGEWRWAPENGDGTLCLQSWRAAAIGGQNRTQRSSATQHPGGGRPASPIASSGRSSTSQSTTAPACATGARFPKQARPRGAIVRRGFRATACDSVAAHVAFDCATPKAHMRVCAVQRHAAKPWAKPSGRLFRTLVGVSFLPATRSLGPNADREAAGQRLVTED